MAANRILIKGSLPLAKRRDILAIVERRSRIARMDLQLSPEGAVLD